MSSILTQKSKALKVEQMRPEDQARERIPWKEMQVGGIYQRKNGKYFIFAGRGVVYHNCGEDVLVRESDKHFYTYIYIDYPAVLCKSVDEDTLSLLCSSAKLRSSEYRDIARTKVGQLEGFVSQKQWKFGDFTVVIEPGVQSKGSTKYKVKNTKQEIAIISNYIRSKRVKK